MPVLPVRGKWQQLRTVTCDWVEFLTDASYLTDASRALHGLNIPSIRVNILLLTWDPALSTTLFFETNSNKLGPQIPPTEAHMVDALHQVFNMHLKRCCFCCSVQMARWRRVDPEWWHLSWKAGDLYSGKLLEASCQKDERKQREAQDLESTFCTYGITNREKVRANYSNCRGICNYYKSSQPTKAMLSTLHEVHWKARRTKVESCMGPFCASDVCTVCVIIK